MSAARRRPSCSAGRCRCRTRRSRRTRRPLPDGAARRINVDGQTPHAHGLMKFPTSSARGPGQVPAGAIITSAVLQLKCTNPGSAMRLYRLTQDWVENQATWNERSPGVAWASPGADGAGSNAGVAVSGDCTATGQRLDRHHAFVQEWSNGSPNYGIVFTESGTDGVDFASSESASSPVLTRDLPEQPAADRDAGRSPVRAPTSVSRPSSPIGPDLLLERSGHGYAGRQAWAPADFALTVDAARRTRPSWSRRPTAQRRRHRRRRSPHVVSESRRRTRSTSACRCGSSRAGVHDHRAARHAALLRGVPGDLHVADAVDRRQQGGAQHRLRHARRRHRRAEQRPVGVAGRANASMSMLDGVVPYGMGPGNHDQPTTLFNQFFPYTRYQGQPWYGGHYQNLNDNNYQLFSGGGMDFVIVHLEFCPPAAAVAWAGIRLPVLSGSHRHDDDARLPGRVGAAVDARLREHAVPLGSAGRAEPEPAVHAERPRPRRIAADRHRQRPPGVSDAGRLPGPRERRRGLAAHSAVRAGRQQGLRPDLFAVAEPLRNRRRQRVHAGLPDGRRLRGRRQQRRRRADRRRRSRSRAWRRTRNTSGG